MSLEDDLKLERYKLVTDRQKYFTELARATFDTYTKIFVSLSAGGIALVSAKSSLGVDSELLPRLVKGIAALVTFMGLASTGQIVFCVVRWYGFRREEHDLYPRAGDPKGWAWVFEGLYMVVIVASIIVVWWAASTFP